LLGKESTSSNRHGEHCAGLVRRREAICCINVLLFWRDFHSLPRIRQGHPKNSSRLSIAKNLISADFRNFAAGKQSKDGENDFYRFYCKMQK